MRLGKEELAMTRNVALGSVVGFAFVVGFFVCNSLRAVVIDDFSQGAVTLVDALGPGSAADLKTGLQGSHTYATARHVTFNAIDPSPFGDTGSVTVQVDTISGGSLKLSADPGLTAANLFCELWCHVAGAAADVVEPGEWRRR